MRTGVLGAQPDHRRGPRARWRAPSSCAPLYGFDVPHFKAYAASAQSEEGWQAYVDQYVACSHSQYRSVAGP